MHVAIHLAPVYVFWNVHGQHYVSVYGAMCRSQWPRGLRRRSKAARLLRSWVWIPPGAWIFVCCECCVLSGRGLCDELITRPEESYRLCCVVVCNLETSRMRRTWPALGRSATGKKNGIVLGWLVDRTEKSLCGVSEMREGLGESRQDSVWPGRDENRSLSGNRWEASCLYLFAL